MAAPGSLSDGTTRVRTVCSYCGVGCGMVLDVGSGPDGRRTVLKATGDKEHPANFGRLCTKGATTADMLAAPSRLATALVRPDRGGEPLPELALGHVRNRALTTGITRLFPLSARKR